MLHFLFILKIRNVEQTLAIHTELSVYIPQYPHKPSSLVLCSCQKVYCLKYAEKVSMQDA